MRPHLRVNTSYVNSILVHRCGRWKPAGAPAGRSARLTATAITNNDDDDGGGGATTTTGQALWAYDALVSAGRALPPPAAASLTTALADVGSEWSAPASRARASTPWPRPPKGSI